jgi:hypothetical protein
VAVDVRASGTYRRQCRRQGTYTRFAMAFRVTACRDAVGNRGRESSAIVHRHPEIAVLDVRALTPRAAVLRQLLEPLLGYDPGIRLGPKTLQFQYVTTNGTSSSSQ